MRKSAAVEALTRAAQAIARGEVVGVPTETYYALATDALDEAALAKLFALKGRPPSQTLSLLVLPEMVSLLAREIPARAQTLMDRYWPGPLTLALPARRDLPAALAAALVDQDSIAVRVPADPLARALLGEVGRPLTATSANRSGEPPCRTPAEVKRAFPSLLVLGTEPTPGGLPSTMIRVTAEGITLLRKGAIVIESEKFGPAGR